MRGALLLSSDCIWTGSGAPAPAWIEVADGRITALGRGRPPRPVDVDLTGRMVIPGLVDIHNHGGGGASFQAGEPDEVGVAAALHRRHGTTTLIASLVTAPIPELAAAVAALAPLVPAGTIAGVHLEGPWLSLAQCGAHRSQDMRPPRPEDVDRLLAAGRGAVRMVTVAPEVDGGLDAVRRLAAAGVIAAVGHTDATHETVCAAIDAGATVATHLCNGMPPIHHRAPGPVVACLADRRVAVELIVDGVHLHDGMARHLATVAGPDRTVLVTDATAATGQGDGEYRLGRRHVVVRGDEVRLRVATSDDRPGPLAGSVLTLDRALRRAVASGIPLLDALAAVTTVPAQAVGLGAVAGTIAVGRRADLVALDESLEVTAILAAGQWIEPLPDRAERLPR